MMKYSFWHGRANRKSDVDWIDGAELSLENNEWITPLYVDGSGWEMDEIREEVAIRLFQALGKNTSAPTLIFQNATLDGPVRDAFELAMEQNNHVSSLTLRNLSGVSASSAASQADTSYYIPACAFLNFQLESLTLVNTSLDKQACKNLSRLIRESTTLASIELEAVQMDHLVSILAAIVMSSSIRSLRLNKMEWSKTDIKRFLMAASFNKSITNLSFEGMNLDISDARLIAQLLQKNQTIQQLSLRKNNFDAKSLQVLVSEGLLKNQSVRTMFLSRNVFGDEGAPHICKLLTGSTTLQELCLVDTKLEIRGCQQIARALRYNTGLKTLFMDGNRFEECAAEMAETLQHNMHLETCLDRLPAILARSSGAKPELSLWKEVDLYMRANQAKRRAFRHKNLEWQHMPYLWENAGAQPDVLFYFIRNSSWNNSSPRPDSSSSTTSE